MQLSKVINRWPIGNLRNRWIKRPIYLCLTSLDDEANNKFTKHSDKSREAIWNKEKAIWFDFAILIETNLIYEWLQKK